MTDIKRHDPFGGAYGAALATGAGDFVFTSVAGVIELRDGVPVFADGFDEQLRLAGRHAATELAEFGFISSDIVDSTVFVHPAVQVHPDLLRDTLSEQVFGGSQPALTIVHAASTYDASLIVIKIIAYKSSR
jgi:enamine deaminase RidA (YjgF/YER057c/UK114 family)